MRLSPATFNRLLADAGDGLGQAIEWRRAHDCPCRDPRSGAPSPDCSVCRNGRIWQPLTCTHLALSGQKLQREWARSGIYENGDVVCTIPSDSLAYTMGDFDRVLFADSSVAFSLVKLNTGPQRTDYRIHRIDRVFWLNADKTDVVEGKAPAVQPDGTLQWRTGAPPAGAQYTITGRKRPEYFAFQDYVQDRAHHGGAALPRRVVLRSFDLYSRGS